MNKVFFIYLLCLATGCTQNRGTHSEKIKSSVEIFFYANFNNQAYELKKDSLKVSSINATLFSSYNMVSHGTDFLIIRDDSTLQFFIVPQHRGTYLPNFYNINTIYTILTNDTLSFYLPALEPMRDGVAGIEHFLSQSDACAKKLFTYDQLDTLLEFHKTYDLGTRIYTAIQLDSALQKVFQTKKKFNGQQKKQINYIKTALKAKLQNNTALIYFAGDVFLNVYEIDPGLDREFVKIPIYNIRKLQIGLNYSDRENNE